MVWRYHCREIEADFLLYYRVDIRDWYYGVMDSRRFLTLLDGLPDESNFKTWAVRQGDWTSDQYVAARTVNEIALSRADGKGYMPDLVRSPFQIEEDQAVDDYRQQKHSNALNELLGGGDGGDHR